MKVKSIMSKNPVFIRDDEFMTRARQLIRDSHFRSLPVIDNARKVIGMITEEEVLKISGDGGDIDVKKLDLKFPYKVLVKLMQGDILKDEVILNLGWKKI